MKKSLVLAMAMALGVTASAYAANPFSDVPAGHWSYDAVSELAAAGVVTGYADGSFGGEKLLTRYEMAQIVAKAMAKGADCEALAVEYAEELDTLGVRVAALENKADKLKVTGQIRYEWAQDKSSLFVDNDDFDHHGRKTTAKNRLRTRLFLEGEINDDWSYGARLQNDQKFNNDTADDELKMNRAYVTGKIGGAKIVAGRQGMVLANGNIYDDSMDGVKVSYGKDVKVTAYYMDPTEGALLGTSVYTELTGQPLPNVPNISADAAAFIKGIPSINAEEVYGVAVDTKVGAVDVTVEYDSFKNVGQDTVDYLAGGHEPIPFDTDLNIYSVTAQYAVGDVGMSATYMYNDNDVTKLAEQELEVDVDKYGYTLGVTYKGAGKDVGSWGAYANYYDQGAISTFAHTMNGSPTNIMKVTGFDGYSLGVNYTIAKNMVATVEYYDLDAKIIDQENKTIFTRLQYSF